jgi:hypothetical protein
LNTASSWTRPLYVPGRTRIVAPSGTVFTAWVMVAHGAAEEPLLVLFPLGLGAT